MKKNGKNSSVYDYWGQAGGKAGAALKLPATADGDAAGKPERHF